MTFSIRYSCNAKIVKNLNLKRLNTFVSRFVLLHRGHEEKARVDAPTEKSRVRIRQEDEEGHWKLET